MCEGCNIEMQEAIRYQEMGYDVGLEEIAGHLMFFVIDKGEVVII